jgi:hypothetical protein
MPAAIERSTYVLASSVALLFSRFLHPSGTAFSDPKGYQDWAVVSSPHTDEVLKVIVADPTMITTFKSGVPVNGQAFPDGSMIVKLQWKPKKSTEDPFVMDVPDVY